MAAGACCPFVRAPLSSGSPRSQKLRPNFSCRRSGGAGLGGRERAGGRAWLRDPSAPQTPPFPPGGLLRSSVPCASLCAPRAQPKPSVSLWTGQPGRPTRDSGASGGPCKAGKHRGSGAPRAQARAQAWGARPGCRVEWGARLCLESWGVNRLTLLAQPPSPFRPFFGGVGWRAREGQVVGLELAASSPSCRQGPGRPPRP